MSENLVVSTTAESRDIAVALARSAVKAKLAASGQVLGPVSCFFWHQGDFGEGEEWIVVLKTTTSRYAELEALLLEEHPWDNPEISAVPIERGSTSYLDWLGRTTASSAGPAE